MAQRYIPDASSRAAAIDIEYPNNNAKINVAMPINRTKCLALLPFPDALVVQSQLQVYKTKCI